MLFFLLLSLYHNNVQKQVQGGRVARTETPSILLQDVSEVTENNSVCVCVCVPCLSIMRSPQCCGVFELDPASVQGVFTAAVTHHLPAS